MYYTGIGSRSTPEDVLVLMAKYARFWADKGWILRSGGAEGADLAFEAGAYWTQGKAEIFLPWNSFNIENRYFEPCLSEPADWTYLIAERFHPAWPYLKWGAKKLHARNVHQIFGPELGSIRSTFVICWTKDGKSEGGTGQAIRIAKAYDIPVYDLGIPEIKEAYELGMKRYNMTEPS